LKKILIVDDAAFTRSIHKQIVIAAGYEAMEASNGAEAIEKFDSEKPDAVMVDLLMPDTDGMDVVKKIREKDSSAKIIVCSADKQKFRQDDAQTAGAIAFLPKPVNPEKLMEILKQISEQ
jgi:two-component system chemotaxis response regulator CheY